MTGTMLAGISSEHGLDLCEVSRPVPAPGQVLVKVAAAGLNRADLNAAKLAAGSAALGHPIGMEWAGTVEAIGEGVTGLSEGDRVACSGTGGYAEYAVTDAGRVLALPPDFDFDFAAALPLALMTAHNALGAAGRLVAGQTVLIHGASSGVGIAALGIARLLGAGKLFCTSTAAEKRARLGELGADAIFDPTEANWSAQLLAATDGRGADLVVDMVTGPGINETMRATAIQGTIVNVGRLGGASAPFDLDLHALRRLNFVGVTFRTRTIEEVRAIVAGVREEIWPHVLDGKLALPLARAFPLAQAREAQAYMADNRHFGKIILRP